MTALPFQHLIGHSIRATLTVDCAMKNDLTKTSSIFQFTCPEDMEITTINKCFGSEERPCSWEVTYSFQPRAFKNCDAANAKEVFENILRFLPANASVTDGDKKIIGLPPSYRVTYNVDTCTCETLDFELPNFM